MQLQFVPIAEADATTLMNSIDKFIVNPLIAFLFACAAVFFLYGVAKYLMSPENEEVRKSSKQHMLWGVIGMFIMVSVFFIMRLITTTLGENRINIGDQGKIEVQKIDLTQ